MFDIFSPIIKSLLHGPWDHMDMTSVKCEKYTKDEKGQFRIRVERILGVNLKRDREKGDKNMNKWMKRLVVMLYK